MSLNRVHVLSIIVFASFSVLGCGQSDYQGGGRRTDLGSAADGISIADGAAGTASAVGGESGTGGSGSSASAGRAGCEASGDGGQSPPKGCVP